jgi:hypothetical protein
VGEKQEMSIIEKLFYNIGFLYTKIRFFNKKDLVQNFTTFLNLNSRILIIMPFNLEEFDIAKKTMISLKNEWPDLQISMIISAQYLTYSGLVDHFKTFALSIKDVNKFFLPTKKFLKPILQHEYDIVIDFNNVMSLTASFISKIIDVDYRISFIKQYVDQFFNVQFNHYSVPENKNIYFSLMNKLKMFCSNEIVKAKEKTEDKPKDKNKADKNKKDKNKIEENNVDKIETDKTEENNIDKTEIDKTEENKIDKDKKEETNREKNNESKKQSKRERYKHKGSGQKNG